MYFLAIVVLYEIISTMYRPRNQINNSFSAKYIHKRSVNYVHVQKLALYISILSWL